MTDPATEFICRACEKRDCEFVRPSTVGRLKSSDFAITNSDYGATAAIYRCRSCGLLQCPESADILKFYEELRDPQYEEGRPQRLLQATHLVFGLLKALGREDGRGLKLLDIGAGSGVLVEAAQQCGFEASGVEPSPWLADLAKRKGLTLHAGVLPHPQLGGSTYDVVTLVDVIEHVTAPLDLLRFSKNHLKADGIIVIVTPDVSSFFARALGFRWWHYRVAHISYFNKKTLLLMSGRAGLKPRRFSRPTWYFSYPYLRARLLKYLPSWLLPPAVGPLRCIAIPLNLGDSLLMIGERA